MFRADAFKATRGSNMALGQAIMIEIRATQDEADLSGSVEDLRGLREAILRFIDSSDRTLVVAASSSLDPSPYAFALPKLMVVRSSGPSQVQVENQQVLIVSGADENLAKFASWFDFDPEATVGVHAHFEHLPGNPYVAPDSLPLIVSVSDEAQQALGGDACEATPSSLSESPSFMSPHHLRQSPGKTWR